MIRTTLFASVAIAGLTAPLFSADFSCKPYEKFNKKSQADQVRLMESSIGLANTDWTVEQLHALSDKLLYCAEKRKRKIQERNAFGSLLGAVGGAIASKDDRKGEGAVAGAAVSASLFAGAKDKKLLSLQAALKQIEISSPVKAKKDGLAPTPSQTPSMDAVPGLSPAQVRLARQAVHDGNEQAAYQTCGSDRDCRKRINNEMTAERTRWGEQIAAENRAKAQAKQARKIEAEQKLAQKKADIEQRTPAYVQNAIEQNASKLAAAGFGNEALASAYGKVSLRAYLSVLIADPNIRIFKEDSLIADVVVVVKPSGKKSSKYYFEFDYGDLTPKAIEQPYYSGLKLVPLLPEKEFTFAALYFAPYRSQIEAGLGY